MALSTDKKFVENITNFTDALEGLVDVLNEQLGKSPTDAVNKLAQNLDSKKIKQIVDDLHHIREKSDKIYNNTTKILSEVKSIKAAKEKGMFGEMGDESKKSVADGVKSIILIAGGVLAIGLAFKIVGKVDFLSVIALSAAIYMMALTFEKIAKIENLTYKKTLQVSGCMIIMAAGILGAGILLNMMPHLNILTMISTMFVTASMAIAMYGMSKAMEHFHLRDWPKYLMFPVLLPLMATGIVADGFVLKQMPIIGFKEALSALFVGIAMIPIAMAFSIVVKALEGDLSATTIITGVGAIPKKKVSMENILFAASVIPIMAAGIVVAGFILTQMPTVGVKEGVSALFVGLAIIPIAFAFSILLKALDGDMPMQTVYDKSLGTITKTKKKVDMKDIFMAASVIPIMALSIVIAAGIISNITEVKWEVIEYSWATSLAILPFALLIVALTKLKINVENVIEGSLGIIAIAATILATSWILSFGKYEAYPTLEWSLGVGLSLLVVGGAAVLVGMFITSTGPAFWLGLVGIIALSATILAVSYILNKGVYDKYPNYDWQLGVGLSLLIFGGAAIVIGLFSIIPIFEIGLLGMILLAMTIVKVAKIIGEGTFDKYPSFDWSKGVGASMLVVGTGVVALGLLMLLPTFWLGLYGVKKIANSIVSVASILNTGKYENYPSLEWAQGVGTSLAAFSSAIMRQGATSLISAIINPIGTLIDMFGGGENDISKKLNPIAYAMINVAKIIDNPIWKKDLGHPTKEWAEGVGLAIGAFSEAMSFMKGGFFELPVSPQQYRFMIQTIASALVDAALALESASMAQGPGFWKKISDGKNYPTRDWSEGVATAIGGFSEAFKVVTGVSNFTSNAELIQQFKTFMMVVAMTMVEVARILNDSNVEFGNYPGSDWSEGVKTAALNFVDIFKEMDDFGDFSDFQESFQTLIGMGSSVYLFSMIIKDIDSSLYTPKGLVDNIGDCLTKLKNALPGNSESDGLFKLATAISFLGLSMENLNSYKVDDLSKLSQSMLILSLIDQKRLSSVLTSLDAKKKELHSIMDSGGGFVSKLFESVDNVLSNAVDKTAGFLGLGSKENEMISPKSDSSGDRKRIEQMETLVTAVTNIDTNIGLLVEGLAPKEKTLTGPENVQD